MHVHVKGHDGDAKFWLEPEIELAMSHDIAQHEINSIQNIIEDHKDELISAWNAHLGS